MHELTISTTKKQQMIDITLQVKEAVMKSGVKDGVCIVYALHTTAGLFINENADPNICEDVLNSLSNMVPNHNNYKHDAIDNNAAAHIKTAIMGNNISLIIHNKAPVLGRWQAILFFELDGPRERKVLIKALGK